ncbi:hypothetical protein [Poriferisphaera sp. WC338]|uniref:hypothetical protein n=1 Tax=Poriferisphaera sp. WC338 TaxID=3425129 RepID=UPI003D8188A1
MTQMQEQQTYIPAHTPQSNSLGTVGFVLSLLGWVIGGLLCPIGFIISLIALKGNPKGLAVAGAIIGGIGSLLGLLVVVVFGGFILAILGLGAAAVALSDTIEITRANMTITDVYEETGALPDAAAGAMILTESGLDLSEYKYEVTGQSTYTITDAGFDGNFGTEDDFVRDYDATEFASKPDQR